MMPSALATARMASQVMAQARAYASTPMRALTLPQPSQGSSLSSQRTISHLSPFPVLARAGTRHRRAEWLRMTSHLPRLRRFASPNGTGASSSGEPLAESSSCMSSTAPHDMPLGLERLLDTNMGGQGASPAPDASTPPAKLDRKGAMQLSLLVCGGMLTTMGIGMIIPVLPAYSESIGLSSSGVGLIVAMPAVARVLLNLPLGSIIDIARKPPLVIGSVLEGLGAIGTAGATSLATMLPPRLLVGAGSAAAGAASQAYTMDVVERYPAQRGLLLGTTQAAYTLAFAAGPACGGWLTQHAGSPSLPFIAIGSSLIISAGMFSFLPESQVAPAASVLPAKTSAMRWETVKGAMQTSIESFSDLIRQQPQCALLCLRFGLITGWSAWLTVLPLHAADIWGATPGDLGTMYSAVALLGFASAPVGGWLADRYGRLRVINCGAGASALALGILPWAGGKVGFYACMGLWDVGEAMMVAASTALAADVTRPAQRGAHASLMNQVQDVTFVFMPVLLGTMAATTSNSSALLLTATCMLASNVGFVALMPRIPPKLNDATFAAATPKARDA